MDGPPFLSRKITRNHQISLPLEFVKPLGIEEGQQVYIGPNPDKPGTLVVITESMMSVVFEKGWSAI